MKIKKIFMSLGESLVQWLILAVAVFAVYQGAVWAYDFGYKIFAQVPLTIGQGRSASVTITESMDAREIGRLLEEEGLIADHTLFAVQYWVSEYRKDQAPGTYTLNSSMTAEEMMRAMAKPEAAPEPAE